MRVLLEVLREQILAVVIAIRRAHDDMDMVAGRDARGMDRPGSDGDLMIEFYEDDWRMDAIIEHGVV